MDCWGCSDLHSPLTSPHPKSKNCSGMSGPFFGTCGGSINLNMRILRFGAFYQALGAGLYALGHFQCSDGFGFKLEGLGFPAAPEAPPPPPKARKARKGASCPPKRPLMLKRPLPQATSGGFEGEGQWSLGWWVAGLWDWGMKLGFWMLG